VDPTFYPLFVGRRGSRVEGASPAGFGGVFLEKKGRTTKGLVEGGRGGYMFFLEGVPPKLRKVALEAQQTVQKAEETKMGIVTLLLILSLFFNQKHSIYSKNLRSTSGTALFRAVERAGTKGLSRPPIVFHGSSQGRHFRAKAERVYSRG